MIALRIYVKSTKKIYQKTLQLKTCIATDLKMAVRICLLLDYWGLRYEPPIPKTATCYPQANSILASEAGQLHNSRKQLNRLIAPSITWCKGCDISRSKIKNMSSKQPSKTETALQMIKYDFAKNGKDTGIATTNYIENRISYEKFLHYAKQGIALYNGAKAF